MQIGPSRSIASLPVAFIALAVMLGCGGTLTVTIEAPAEGETVIGVAAVSGTASNDVVLVEVSVDDGIFASASGTSSWSYSLDTAWLTNGPHTLTARATVASGSTQTASRSFNVQNDTGEPPPPPCTLDATPATFAAQVSAATAGQTLCLATGDYGTWNGTNKVITVRRADGATPTMKVNFGASASGFTLDGMSGMGGSIQGSNSVTIRRSTFTSAISIDNTTETSNILLDRNTHNNIDAGGSPARVMGWSAFTIQNSLLEGGDSDGVRIDGPGIRVLNNEFKDILIGGPNHTDMIQFYGGSDAIIRGNWFRQTISGDTQVLSAYDSTSGNLIEDNVVHVSSRPWSIELYSDDGSIVRHNTLVYGSCAFNLKCGLIDITRKSADDPGVNTQVYDNVATAVQIGNGSTVARRDHNMLRQSVESGDFLGTPVFAGGANPTTYAGYRLADGSPGKGAASDGLDVGIR